MSTPRDLHLLHRPTTTPVRSPAFDENATATVTAVAATGRPAVARSAARTDSTVRAAAAAAAVAAPAARGGRLPGFGGVTVEELQAAYDAARSGTFAEMRRGYAPQQGRYAPARGRYAPAWGRYAELPTTASPYAGDDAGRGPASEGAGPWGPGLRSACPDDAVEVGLGGPVVAVVAAHAGAGASTVALAIAEALSAAGVGARLIDTAEPGRSGLASACTAELGPLGSRWRRGRRGRLEIDRPVGRFAGFDDLPAPSAGADRRGAVVLDLGCPRPANGAAEGWAGRLPGSGLLVLVCRPTVPGVRQAEALLAELGDGREVIVAAPGKAHWPGAVTASCGPRLRAARAGRRVVAVPIVRQLQITGLTADPLPKSVAAAGRQIAAHLPPGAAMPPDQSENERRDHP